MPKVLFIDDEIDVILPFAFWFKSQGYAVMTASTCDEALKSVKDDTPDVVFLDIHMPDSDGFAMLKKIKAVNEAVPVIMMSAYIGDNVTEKEEKGAIAGIFYKGDDFSKALALAESVLNKKK